MDSPALTSPVGVGSTFLTVCMFTIIINNNNLIMRLNYKRCKYTRYSCMATGDEFLPAAQRGD